MQNSAAKARRTLANRPANVAKMALN